ncbi:hypothetical protein C8R43DRAFT_1134534 [Mycena crocata]|nr:hypothetical protein C8R43DRAFT_1134534 [Mycena crocata]
MTALLKACNDGLQEALEVFKVENVNLSDIVNMQQYAEDRHRKILELNNRYN